MANGDVVVLARPIVEYNDEVLKFMGDRVERKVQDAIFKLAQETRDMARRKTPSKTGALRASIYVSKGVEPAGPNRAYTKQSTHAYFKAVNASINKNDKLSVFHADEKLVNPRTNRPFKSAAEQFNVSRSKINGTAFKTYAHFETIDFGGDLGNQAVGLLTPTITELGAAGRNQFFVTVGAAAYYAGWIEFGHVTRGHKGTVPPRPFLTPALEWAAAEAPIRIRAILQQEGLT